MPASRTARPKPGKKPPANFVVLLRGVNVGGNATVPMAALKECLEQLGYRDVRTYINSGNAIFRHPAALPARIAARIEKALRERFGREIRATVRTRAQIEAVCRKMPAKWVNDAAMRTDVLFLWDEVDSPRVLKEIAQNPAVDRLLFAPGAVIWNFDRVHYTKSRMHKFIGTRVYKHMTARNANTVRKLRAMMAGE